MSFYLRPIVFSLILVEAVFFLGSLIRGPPNVLPLSIIAFLLGNVLRAISISALSG